MLDFSKEMWLYFGAETSRSRAVEPGKRLWFKRRQFGWGWTPVTIEGWAIVIGFILAVALMAATMDKRSPLYYAGLAGATALLMAICRVKGETPKWQWGKRD